MEALKARMDQGTKCLDGFCPHPSRARCCSNIGTLQNSDRITEMRVFRFPARNEIPNLPLAPI